MTLIRFLALAALLALAMLAVAMIPSTDKRLISGALLDAGHIPLYAVFAIILLRLLRIAPGIAQRGALLQYSLAFLGVVFFGLLTEFVQIFVQRDAQALDFVRDLLGGGGALLLHLAFERRERWLLAGSLTVAALGLWGAGLVELASITRDYRARDRAFPVLCAFDDAWEERFVRALDGEVTRIQPPSDWPSAGMVGRVALRVAEYPGLLIREPVADWTEYRNLRLRIRSDEPLNLVLRVHDEWHDETYTDRFNRNLEISEGVSEIRIPLDEIVSGPQGRQTDMSRIAGLALFAEFPDRELVFLVERIDLD